jgi:hypothetical protein
MTSVALLALVIAGFGAADDFDFGFLPPTMPSRDFVEHAAHYIHGGPPAKDDVDRLVDYFSAGAYFRMGAMQASDRDWREECDRIAQALHKRNATLAELFSWQDHYGSSDDAASRTYAIRKQLAKKRLQVRGAVLDRDSGAPIEKAVVRGEWPDRATTDAAGKFSIETTTGISDRFLLTIEAEGKARFKFEKQ